MENPIKISSYSIVSIYKTGDLDNLSDFNYNKEVEVA